MRVLKGEACIAPGDSGVRVELPIVAEADVVVAAVVGRLDAARPAEAEVVGRERNGVRTVESISNSSSRG
jgi:hypothetical protein